MNLFNIFQFKWGTTLNMLWGIRDGLQLPLQRDGRMRWGSLRRSRRAGFSHFKKQEPTLRPATWEDEGDPLHLNESRCRLQTRRPGFQARKVKGSRLHARTVGSCSFSELLIIGAVRQLCGREIISLVRLWTKQERQQIFSFSFSCGYTTWPQI